MKNTAIYRHILIYANKDGENYPGGVPELYKKDSEYKYKWKRNIHLDSNQIEEIFLELQHDNIFTNEPVGINNQGFNNPLITISGVINNWSDQNGGKYFAKHIDGIVEGKVGYSTIEIRYNL